MFLIFIGLILMVIININKNACAVFDVAGASDEETVIVISVSLNPITGKKHYQVFY
jgi:hypothetical protein